jgi:hypothetical protein
VIPIDWLRDVLERHDPLGAWPPTATLERDYRRVAELAAQDLTRIQGLGHIRVVVSDALDRLHPGLYRAAREDRELARRLGQVAREIWEARPRHSGGVTPADRAPPATAPPLDDEAQLIAWLRDVEGGLQAEQNAPRERRPVAAAFHSRLPALIETYLAAPDAQREATRLAFSRFRLVLYRVSMFAAAQLSELKGPHAELALRSALMAESILDLGLDWRDELLLLRDLRRMSESLGLPFEKLLRQAADCSSQRGAAFLMGVLNER